MFYSSTVLQLQEPPLQTNPSTRTQDSFDCSKREADLIAQICYVVQSDINIEFLGTHTLFLCGFSIYVEFFKKSIFFTKNI
jgi:hypothetical protein